MIRRRPGRRLAALLLALAPVAALAACGEEAPPGLEAETGSKTAEGAAAFTVSGDVGESPKVTWKARMKADDIEHETLVTGDGPALEEGASALAHLWIGNGYTQKSGYDTREEGAQLLTANGELPEFLAPVKGATVGSRILVTGSAEKVFGEGGNPALGIGNKDTVAVIIDLVSDLAKLPTDIRADGPPWMPRIVTNDDKLPTGFNFSDATAPDDKLHKAVLLNGKGAKVEKGQTIAVNYLGQVYEGKKPFDESFSKPAPTTFQIGTGAVIKAWDQALVGVTVGSRVVIAVPPELGYGEKGNKDAGIKGTDTLFFVIDVLGAA
ncbi:FKBP-type peptidyl-prolyl cis-trans isomerase [Nocardioides sp. SYSU D00038]|uniref:FKBP-type peptidyl-prolyl cis-trans isomerase n=1 Tax=Nocardioides sp. SYSU D00038 TaxID=2812554 RepID=UPI0019670F2F|nr:FKBP-type peptidyl-prolyl cis-trans isomerase [Nocardioides sp. SYSU D00038]